MKKAINVRGRTIAIFPSGTTNIERDTEWRFGAFRIAQETNGNIRPFRISYSKERHAAYVGDDMFVTHLWRLIRGPKIKAVIEFGDLNTIADYSEDIHPIKAWVDARDPVCS